MTAPFYVLWKGPTTWVLSLDGYPSRAEADRAIRWQETGGSSILSDWAVCRRTGPDTFIGLYGTPYRAERAGRTERAWSDFMAGWEA